MATEEEVKKEKCKDRGSLFSLKYLVYDICRFFVIIPGMLIFRPKYVYENEEARKKIRGGALLVSNHTMVVDPMHLMIGIWYRRQHFVVAKEIMEKKQLHLVLKAALAIPVDRENYNLDSFRMIVDRLKEGRVVTIFAEGHINREGELDPFKSGMVLMSLQSGKPIVPVYIKNRKHFYERLTFVVGEKMNPAGENGRRPGMAQINRFTELVREKENKLKLIVEEE